MLRTIPHGVGKGDMVAIAGRNSDPPHGRSFGKTQPTARNDQCRALVNRDTQPVRMIDRTDGGSECRIDFDDFHAGAECR